DMDEAAFEGWFGSPAVRADRVWTVWDGDRIVATSFLAYPPVRGNVWTEYTACARDHRGRGIATAVKLETVGQAIELGVARIRTDNDEENAPMLAINRRLRYAPVHRLFEWSKAVPAPAR
ncbi:MAG: GNAT family N-acetyltransferase, partial [Candidatus Dormiibacterota bacterium]